MRSALSRPLKTVRMDMDMDMDIGYTWACRFPPSDTCLLNGNGKKQSKAKQDDSIVTHIYQYSSERSFAFIYFV